MVYKRGFEGGSVLSATWGGAVSWSIGREYTFGGFMYTFLDNTWDEYAFAID